MATKTKKAYRVDLEKKIITIDDGVKATAAEEKDIAMYVAAGYKIRHKSVKRAKNAAERAAKDNLKDKDILEALKGDKENLAEYEKIKKEEGFFKARSWYKKLNK